MEIYFGHGIAYFEDLNAMNCIMNEIILECLIFEFMKSKNIGIWCCIVYLRSYDWIHEVKNLWIKGRDNQGLSLSNGYDIVEEQ